MRLANLAGRAVVVVGAGGDRAIDVERASDGGFSSDPQRAYEDWAGFSAWASGLADEGESFDPADLQAPVPRPRQVFAIGVNYAAHAAEGGWAPDTMPVVFTKFPSCIVGPNAVVPLPEGNNDWEVELVVVIGEEARNVPAADGWRHVAGVTIGQDISERLAQMAGDRPQFSLAKSHEGFGPTGPWLVTPDELPDRDDLAISDTVSGQQMQSSRTSKMIYSVPVLIERLSAVCTLYPGDLIFSGTPEGVGNRMNPPRFLNPDDVLVSTIEGIGSITQTFRRA
ncbi:fumarylacetoacetate hydrolase family protein [Naasia lichenicola]|uniref:Fumarylacetoacetate hydrolase family protein n=1 Tax=Naasia lichenicola TaxID=2565933 RepID=A0A4S4FM98_9MICO|nr:fumarylacetoacetate hydrolase family protein [Naasia lichenicola]THG31620.1 fumarylacetoacetate hydrolase family protein [Naasia lichenicola]